MISGNTSLTILLFFLITEISAQTTITSSFAYNGRIREYAIYEPANFLNSRAVPLILVLHHNGATGTGVMNYMGFKPIADTAGFISVYPTALEDQFASPHAWNAGLNPLNPIDDVGFLSTLIDTVMNRYWIDSNRVYATGHSMGGYMSHRLGCQLSERIAAIAPSAGTLASWIAPSCNPPRPMPVLHKHGTNDNRVKWDGSAPPFSTSVDATIHFWVQHNQCAGMPVVTQLPDLVNDGYYYETTHYKGCAGNSEVILLKGAGAPHGWHAVGHDISPPSEVWKFFMRHTLHEPLPDSTSTATNLSVVEPALQAFPNPFQNVINLKISTFDATQIRIYDMAGRIVAKPDLEAELTIETTNWSSGIYLLEYLSENTVHWMRLVKAD